MKRNISFLTVLIASIVLSSCSKNSDDNTTPNTPNTIKVSVENGASYSGTIDQARISYYKPNSSGTGNTNTELQSVPYNNGVFSFTLPASIELTASDVVDLSPDLSTDEVLVQNTLKISDAAAHVNSIDLYAFKNDKMVGYFGHQLTDGKKQYSDAYLYADRDVTITGTLSTKYTPTAELNNLTYNLSLKKGWNLVYNILTETGSYYGLDETYTSTAPGVTLKWIFKANSALSLVPMRHPSIMLNKLASEILPKAAFH